jgi:hypothetical protein
VTTLVDACNDARVHRSLAAIARFQTLLCRLSITFAHELAHVYTLFLQRVKSEHTPPRLSYGGYGDDEVGESGRYWESRVFGGTVDMREGPQIEAIALCGHPSGKVWRLRSHLIQRLIARDFSWLEEPLIDRDNPYRCQATEQTDRYDWLHHNRDILPPDPPVPTGPQELSSRQVRELLELNNTQFPAYSMRGDELRAFSRDPTLPVRVY